MWENVQNRIEELLSQQGMRLQGQTGSGILWSKDNAYAQVFSLERPGRVRGMGLGINPSGRSEMLHSLPRLHSCQVEQPKGFRSWRTTPLD